MNCCLTGIRGLVLRKDVHSIWRNSVRNEGTTAIPLTCLPGADLELWCSSEEEEDDFEWCSSCSADKAMVSDTLDIASFSTTGIVGLT